MANYGITVSGDNAVRHLLASSGGSHRWHLS